MSVARKSQDKGQNQKSSFNQVDDPNGFEFIKNRKDSMFIQYQIDTKSHQFSMNENFSANSPSFIYHAQTPSIDQQQQRQRPAQDQQQLVNNTIQQQSSNGMVKLPFIRKQQNKDDSAYNKYHSLNGAYSGNRTYQKQQSENLSNQYQTGINVIEEIDQKQHKIVLLTENNFQKLKLRKKNKTQRQNNKYAGGSNTDLDEILMRNEKIINNLHNNLTVNGQKQEILAVQQNNHSPDVNQTKRMKQKRGMNKSQDPGQIVSDAPNKSTSTYREQSLNQPQNIIQPVIKSQYNHHFSNLKGNLRGSNALASFTDEMLSITASNKPEQQRSDSQRLHRFQFIQDQSKNITQQSTYQDNNQIYEDLGSITPQNKEPVSVNSSRQTPYQNPTSQSTALGDIKNMAVGGFASPSLEYRKKKKGYYMSNNSVQNKNHQLFPVQMQHQFISLQKPPLAQNISENQSQRSPPIKLQNQNINSLIHQLNMNRIGNPHLSFAQILRNMNSKTNYNQVQLSNLETLEALQKDLYQNTNKSKQFSLLIRSASQEFESLQPTTNSNGKLTTSQHQIQPLDKIVEDTQQINNALVLKSNNPIEAKVQEPSQYKQVSKKLLNANELYELARSMKYQGKHQKEGKKYINLSQDIIQQNGQNAGKNSNKEDNKTTVDQRFVGALNIKKIKQQSARAEADIYQMKHRDMQLILKYSKKSQNLLNSFEEYNQNQTIGNANNSTGIGPNTISGATVSRNQQQNINKASKSTHRDNYSSSNNNKDNSKVNQSADFSIAQNNNNNSSSQHQSFSTNQLLSIQEIQPVLRVHENDKQKTQNQKEEQEQEETKTQQIKPSRKPYVKPKLVQQQKQQQQQALDIEKLLYGISSNQQQDTAKSRIEYTIKGDLTNSEFMNHPLNKAIKHMGYLSTLLFRTKEIGPQQIELFQRCVRFFNIPVQKQFKSDVLGLMKNKEFLTIAKEKMHFMLFNQVNKANNQIDFNNGNSNAQPRYFIGNGNNHMLVKSIFKQRSSWWTQSEKESFEECSFIWTQWLKDKHIQQLIPLSKRNQGANQQDPQESQQIDPNSILPLTFVIENGLNDLEFDAFEKHFQELAQKQPAIQNVWIIKPGEDTNRGSGIIVSKDFQEIKQLVRDKASRGVDKTAILQKYIENPLLINKRKFDMRCYGLLTSVNGQLLGYFYQDGYIRTSCKEFNVNNLQNKFIHLTNDAIQKYSEDYGKFENANKLSFQDFDKYFENNSNNCDYDVKFQRDFLPQIRAVICDSFKAIEQKIDPERRLNSFEIFGYDFMIDENFQLKLIEANTNPCLEICCPLLARIIPNLLDSAFKIAIDPLYPPPISKKGINPWGGGNEVLNELKMELIFQSQNKNE